MELVSIETCRMLHRLRYFGNLRSVKVESETLTEEGDGREERTEPPKVRVPRLHEVSDWLRTKHKINVRIECIPKYGKMTHDSTIWRSHVYYRKKGHILGKRTYHEYGLALEEAINIALKLI